MNTLKKPKNLWRIKKALNGAYSNGRDRIRAQAIDTAGNAGDWADSGVLITVSVVKYYAFGSQTVMEKRGDAVIYLSTDQISSTSLITDANGAEISQVRYDPYGAVRWSSGTIPTDKTFTGQRSESFGLLDYKARYYSPDLGHFIQADTLIPGPGNPLAWDRYAYVQNNPLIYVDPSGNRPCTDDPEFSDCENGLPHVPRKSNYDPVKIDTNFPTDDIHSLYIAYKYTRGWWNDFGYGSPYFSKVDFLELMLSYEFSTLPRINDFPIQYPGQLENLAHATAHWFFFKV